MEKTSKTTSENIRSSVSALYKQLLDKRHKEAEEKEERQAEKKREKEEIEEKQPDEKLSKKERRQAELDNWKEIVVGLTGDDLEYTSKKQKKKKYKKWIDENENTVTPVKQKKAKKRNYNKEFEPELNMLRTLIADQNKFTADLQKRFTNAAGPATKDAMLPTKTLVELASAIMSGRSNSLGMLREVGSIKKTIADLYLRQKKLDSELAGGSVDTTDLGLFGSNLAASMFNTANDTMPVEHQTMTVTPQSTYTQPSSQRPPSGTDNIIEAEVFDPSTWEGPEIANAYTMFENIPHEIVVKQDQSGNRRFAAIREDNGEELVGCPVPTADPNKLVYNEKDNVIRGPFDEVFKVISE